MKQLICILSVLCMISMGFTSLASARLDEKVASLSWVHIAPGAQHSIGLKSDGTVWAWGNNEYGQLGIGTKGESEKETLPVQVVGLSDIASVGAGAYYSLAVKKDGTVWAWGENSSAQLGDGSISITRNGYANDLILDANKSLPVQVRGINEVVSATGEFATTYAIKKDGTVWKWGGSSGRGFTAETFDYTSLKLPEQVIGLNHITSISMGWTAHLAINQTGTLYVDGYHGYGEQGDGTVESLFTKFDTRTIAGFEQVISASSGVNYDLAVKKDGTVWAWGNLRRTNNPNDKVSIPMRIKSFTDVKAVAAGALNLILKADGTVWSFKSFEVSDIGDKQWDVTVNATQVEGLSNIKSIEAGGGWAHFVALDDQGIAWVWGNNASGELGIGTTSYSSKPILLPASLQAEPIDKPNKNSDVSTQPTNDDLKMTIRGQAVNFVFGEPFIDNNRSLFPLRDLLVSLGVTNDEEHIIWNKDEQSVTALSGDVTIKLAVGQKEFYKNNVLFSMLDVPASNVDGRVYLPARAVAEALGFQIQFNATTNTVTVTE